MAENRFITKEEKEQGQPFETPVQEALENKKPDEKEGKRRRSRKRSDKGAKTFFSVLGGNFLIREAIAKQFPFMVYVTILLMIIITNTYIAEDTTRKIAKTTRKISDLHVEYVQLKSSIMQASKQSVLARKLEDSGLKETVDPLRRIKYNNEESLDETE